MTYVNARLPQILWISEYEADVEADFLRFYGVYDYDEVDAQKFLRLASRLFAYEGVMTARYAAEREKPGGETTTVATNKYQRDKMYKEANVQRKEVAVQGKGYLEDKLKGPTL